MIKTLNSRPAGPARRYAGAELTLAAVFDEYMVL